MPPLSVVFKEMNWSFENSCTCRVVDPKITDDGLSLQGYLWRVDRQVFFKGIQDKYGSKYMKIQNDEAKLQYHPKFARIYWEIMTELCQQNMLPLANAIWHFVRAEVGYFISSPSSTRKTTVHLTWSLRMIRVKFSRKMLIPDR
jgi:hypothetical protein